MQQILSNEILAEKLLKEGYVVIPFLNENEVNGLVNFYHENHLTTTAGMYATAHVPDTSFRMKMNNFIKQVFARAIGETFVGCNPLGGSFIAKGKGPKGTLHPHQDWNIVDEEEFRSFNIWVPLVDLNENNGVIKILPRSHAWLQTFRSANISSAYGEVNDLLWEKTIPLYLKKGEALVYDHRLLHASGENFTDELRLAAVYGIIPEDAQMYYYHKADDNTIEVFESNPDFFLFGNIFEGPKNLKSIHKFPHDFQHDKNKLSALITGEVYEESIHRKSFWDRLKSSLNF